ncbi:hypothetical protein ZWY2020_028684 [Hordeum vulgare]|nr:hypothetical protein ZWY2020_028684 [Hordeum vulgare]
MEIPTATIHRLLSSIREGTTAAPPAPPFPSVADAVAAFEADASPELLRGRCGAAGGLLRGAQSAFCFYCGSPGGRAMVSPSEAVRPTSGCSARSGSMDLKLELLSGSLDLVESRPMKAKSSLLLLMVVFAPPLQALVEFDGDSTDSNKSKEKPKGKEIAATAAALPLNHTIVQEKHSSSHESSSSESTGSESVVGDSKQLDLFKSASVAEPSNFPVSGTAMGPVLAAGNQTNIDSEDLASALNVDNLFIQKAVPAIAETNVRIGAGNSVAEFTGSSLDKNSVESSELSGRSDIGVSIDEGFDDWQEFAEGGNQGILPNVGEHTEMPSESDSSQIKGMDPLSVRSMESPNNVSGDSDDWQDFAQSSAQGDSAKLVEGSSCGQGGDGSGNPVAETSISLEHSLEAHAVDLWPVGNVKEHNSTEIGKQTDDSFDDWQDFTTPGQAQVASFNESGQLAEVSPVSHREIDVNTWFTENSKESRCTDLVNRNNIMLDDWQGFAGSDQIQQSSCNVGGELMDISFEQLHGTGPVQLSANASSNKTTNIVEDNTFDIWQDVAAPSVPAKEIDSMDLWLTSNIKESNSCSKDVNGIHDSPDKWQDFASFGQAQGNMKIPVDRHFAQSAPSQCQVHKQDNSNEANAAPPGEHERMSVMHQVGGVDALSATSHDSKSRPKSEAGNANVEKLLSQMHDLSFMLKDELSIPSKSADRPVLKVAEIHSNNVLFAIPGWTAFWSSSLRLQNQPHQLSYLVDGKRLVLVVKGKKITRADGSPGTLYLTTSFCLLLIYCTLHLSISNCHPKQIVIPDEGIARLAATVLLYALAWFFSFLAFHDL